jgi:GntR family transcriptional regulator, transcriptional repressor for pyruvate dehydrogenase complex
MILLRTTEKSAVDELVAADIEFHSAIAVAAGNPVLASLIEGLSGPTQRARVWRGLTEEGALNRTQSEHRSILLAIKQRDPELARTWATVHIAGVEEWLRRALADPESYLAGEPALAAVVQSRA